MKEIKYRVWATINECYLDMDSGYFYLAPDGTFYEIIEMRNGKIDYNEVNGDVQFYTGRKDHKGKEIYEGDIVKTEEYFGGDDETDSTNLFEVVFEDGKFIAKLIGFAGGFDLVEIEGACEIVGNIYENSELLE